MSDLNSSIFAGPQNGAWASQWREALRSYNLDTDRVQARLIGYSENATYRCEDAESGHSYILRLHRPGFRSKSHIRSEVQWIEQLRQDRVVSTPGVRRTASGELVGEFSTADGTVQYAVLFEHMRGTEPSVDSLASVMFQIGTLTARLHQHARLWSRPEGFERPEWTIRTLIGQDSLWGRWTDTPEVDVIPGARSLLRDAERKATDELAEYGMARDRYGLIHGDLRSTNLLIEDTQVNVIDFDDCGFGWFMYDLACSLSFNEHHQMVDRWVQEWIRGYNCVHQLRAEDVYVIPALVMIRRLLLVSWLEARRETELANGIRGTFVEESVEIARKYLSDEFLAFCLVPVEAGT